MTHHPPRALTATALGLVATALVVAGCTSPPNDYAPRDDGPARLNAGAADGAGSAAHVEMKDVKFAPATLTIAAGTSVTWTNHDPMGHTVTPVDKAQWGTSGSGDAPAQWLQDGQTWSFRFTEPGVYEYYCLPHASESASHGWVGMVGTVIVGDAGRTKAAPVPATRVVPDPVAPPRLLPSGDGKVHITLETREVPAQLADGVGYTFWTFGGTVPGPMLRIREGDTVEVNLVNSPDSTMPHSVDFHAATGPGGGAAATQTPPGESRSFQFKALNPGVFVYHCATPHVPSHIANGMYGLIVVEPKEGLPAVDREFYVVQGEVYTTGRLGAPGMQALDLQKLRGEDPEYFLFNGRVGALTGDGALTAEVGDTVRLFVGVGGFAISSFHVIGEIFDRVYPEGGFPPVEHVQTTLIPAGGATIVEFKVEVPGTYALVDHTLVRAIDRGAAGHLVVTGPADPAVFRAGA
jgi:nitrite reductase (NO-forming)